MAEYIEITDADYGPLTEYFLKNGHRKIFLVCDSSLQFLKIDGYLRNLEAEAGIETVSFSDFTPNPLYEAVEKGVALFNGSGCDMIFAVGGGSAMDVAKCIKLYSGMDPTRNYLDQTIVPNDIKLMAMPTTAGTGSEATRYAVIYYNGEKQSVTDRSCIPEVVVFDRSVLKTLPDYQKKATMMDALCHAVESFWSVNSTRESREYAGQAIESIFQNKDAYLANEDEGNAGMFRAAHLAGKAINITQTTAGHAMCYKLTSLYGIAHGHAAALCVKYLWPYMEAHTDQCIDPRGKAYLEGVFAELDRMFGGKNDTKGYTVFETIVRELELPVPRADEKDYRILRSSVNPVRLKNNPVLLDEDTLDALYHQILRK